MGVIKHSIQRTGSVIGVLATITIIGFLLYSVWVSFIKPNTKYRLASTTQKAEKIENFTYNYPERKSLIQFKIWFIKVRLW